MNKENKDKIINSYKPIFQAVEKLSKKNKPLIIAIDGRCGSGKSYLASLLAEQFDCNVFHMDDFFLPFEMRTSERLAQPGGNVHYERVEKEVLKVLQNRKAVRYQPYLCSKREFGEYIQVEFKYITIVEGSYSLHSALHQAYNYKLFMTVDSEVQYDRIRNRNRNGEEMAQNFLDKWIPMEERYFSELNIEDQCDLIVDTTRIWG